MSKPRNTKWSGSSKYVYLSLLAFISHMVDRPELSTGMRLKLAMRKLNGGEVISMIGR
jgi:hypothetical protein